MNEKSKNISVFILDSSVLMRRILSSMIIKEKGVTLSGSSGHYDFKIISSKFKLSKPDLLFLGVDHLHSDGMKLFHELRKTFPDLYIVLLTHLNRDGASVALEGVKNGALDYVTKPENSKSMIFADNHFRKRVIPLLKALPKLNRKGNELIHGNRSERNVSNEFFPNVGRMSPERIDLIVIGSCLGGISSIFKILPMLPSNLPVPVFVVQHMPGIYTEVFAKELDKITSANVREAQHESSLTPGTVYVAPGGFHSIIKNENGEKQIALHKGPRENKCRPSIDVMLRSAVQEFGSGVLAIFASGGGNDGVLGALGVLENGGAILLESRESALTSGLTRKVKILNNEIREVTAADMSSKIVELIDSVDRRRKKQLARQVLNSSGNYSSSFEP